MAMSSRQADRLVSAQRSHFVGRTAELDLFHTAVTHPELPLNVLYHVLTVLAGRNPPSFGWRAGAGRESYPTPCYRSCVTRLTRCSDGASMRHTPLHLSKGQTHGGISRPASRCLEQS